MARELFEFLQTQDQETLPQELKDVLKWHNDKSETSVSPPLLLIL